MLIDTCPHVYFAANQDTFATKVLTDVDGAPFVCLVLIPKFRTTRQLVLVDLDDLTSKTVEIVCP